MAHEFTEIDGMKVLVVSAMNRRFDENGVELHTREFPEKLQIVHAEEIARYYGLDYQDVGYGDNRIPGVWSLVHGNIIGQRVPYNAETSAPLDRQVIVWEVIKDGRGMPIDTKEVIKINDNKTPGQTHYELTQETDDGMYVRLDDLMKFAKVRAGQKGQGSRPRPRKRCRKIGSAGLKSWSKHSSGLSRHRRSPPT